MQDLKHNDIKKRHNKRQLKRRRQQLIRRSITLSALAALVLCIIIFLTPLFDIRKVDITGNAKIPTPELQPIAEKLKGKNILFTGKNDILKELAIFPYVETVTVNKKLFSSTITVNIIECEPAAIIMHNSEFVLIDATGKILEVGSNKPELAEIVGLRLTSANPGEIISLDDNGKRETVINALTDFKKSGLLSGITKISFEDIDDITFNYENRLDGVCGPYVDFGRKLSMFRESISSNRFTENTRGTIDLSKSGKARYTP
ncbi:MAG: FtsQ-type POTRA domain-containing protein [Clostridia bacterium]|nr:FtsQ-type POTRA domain-containing protein [Clostridia bacterium]